MFPVPRPSTTRWFAPVLVACLGSAALFAADLPPAASRPVDFVQDIQPIFAEHCASCHGPDKQKSGYRLDVREVALKGGDSGHPAILPGAGATSPIVHWVAALDPDEVMPPTGTRLSDTQIGLLRAWIDQGAVWPDSASTKVADALDWWSLRPLHQPPLPPNATAAHPIDAFIQARLAQEGWKPSPPADRRTLIRRVALDLTGLPPSPEEVAAFVTDTHPRAYERLVDRLLASPRYGERWARHWLDVVHYGDTQGYDKDKPRPNAWPYRDYVIRSFNADKRYDRFVQEQIAGDVLFPDTAEGIEALGFIAAGPWDFIGHEEVPETKTDGRIARHLDRDNMVANTIGTFASLTVHCAQCHDHKFDPIPQADYFALQAVFAAVDRTERRYHHDPATNRLRTEREERVRTLTQRERDLRDAVNKAGGDSLKRLDDQISAAQKTGGDAQPAEYGWHSEIASRETDLKWVQVDLGRSVPLDRIVLAPARDAFNNIGDGFGFPRRFKVELCEDASIASGAILIADHTTEDVPNPGVARQTFPVGGKSARFIRVTATRLAPRQDDFIFALAELEAFDGGGTNLARQATVTSLDSIEAPPRWARHNLVDGRGPGKPVAPEEIVRLKEERETLLQTKVDASLRQELAAATTALQAAKKAVDELPAPSKVFVGAVHYGSGNFKGTGPNGGRPRPIHLLHRGDVTKPGPEVQPGALRCVTSLPADFALSKDHSEGIRRAALAEWLTDPRHPLTWRSIVNRVWQYHFGRGIVDTPNDFGRMGGRPSHPELLDWLAAEFRDGGQSLKDLHRLIVTSATYQQSSHASTAPGSPSVQDSDNRLLSRMNPRRLEAEAVRDSILAVSGKLDLTPYGPGFQDFVVEKPEHSPHYEYHLYDPEDVRTHRRSVYRFLVRSQLEPFMTALDCADPSMRVDRRNETLTPLQALALMNGKLSVAMAKHFAQRIQRESGTDATAEAQVQRAFQLALQRDPTPSEQATLAPYTTRHGLAATCRVMLNLNEFVFVD